MSTISFHDVKKIEVKAPQFSNGHSWTMLIITHKTHGLDADGEYAEITATTEIALHHSGAFHGTLPLLLDGVAS